MFCYTCGEKLEETFLFCPKCGAKVDQEISKPLLKKTEKVVETFGSYSKRKERERAQFFRPKSKTKGTGKSKCQATEDLTEHVKVNVGIMVNNGSGLQPLRGKGLSVSVRKNCGRDELLKAATDKHKAHSTDIINPLCTSFTLLYSDGTAIDKLRESNDDFVLHKYKNECGKQYQRITFYLCTALDFSKSKLEEMLNHYSESSDEGSAEEMKEKIGKNWREYQRIRR